MLNHHTPCSIFPGAGSIFHMLHHQNLWVLFPFFQILPPSILTWVSQWKDLPPANCIYISKCPCDPNCVFGVNRFSISLFVCEIFNGVSWLQDRSSIMPSASVGLHIRKLPNVVLDAYFIMSWGYEMDNLTISSSNPQRVLQHITKMINVFENHLEGLWALTAFVVLGKWLNLLYENVSRILHDRWSPSTLASQGRWHV